MDQTMDQSKPSSLEQAEAPQDSSSAPAAAAQRNDEAAAVTMQKNYRGYRLRRQLADCAVVAKTYRWWNVLEGARLQKTSECIDEHEDIHQRWKRIVKNAAKLGKGLSNDETALKLAFQHWLEAIDPRHRYGHNLTQYYNVWLKSGTTERFFYWLDVGGGKQVDLKECPRSKLCKEQISYLGPKQRRNYEASIVDGRLRYQKSGKLIDTSDDDAEKWIFVMSTTGKLYVGQKKRGEFQHSIFLAGGAAKAAGRLLATNGVLKEVEPHSGHYRPSEDNFKSFQQQLRDQGLDLSTVKFAPLKDKIKDEDTPLFSSMSGDVSNFDAVVQALRADDGDEVPNSDNGDGAGLESPAPAPAPAPLETTTMNGGGAEGEEHGEVIKQGASKSPKMKKRPSFSWTSAGGARLSSLSVLPQDQLTKALEEIGTPRAEPGSS